MTYLVTRRFKAKTMSGIVNLPYGTACELRGETIYHGGKPLCFVTSENAHQYFSRNDDGQGERRGELVHDILARLTKNDIKYFESDISTFGGGKIYPEKFAAYNAREKERQAAWDRVWGDLSIRKYKRVEFADYWLFNHNFYNAPIEDLEYILKVVKGETNGQNNQN